MYFWTEHSKFKMKQYNLSQQRIKRIIRFPKRIEEGIVKNTIAVMQPVSMKIKNKKETWNQEIWAMYQVKSKVESQKSKVKIQKSKVFEKKLKTKNCLSCRQVSKLKPIKIISAWRYPGVSPKNNPVPKEILEEILNLC